MTVWFTSDLHFYHQNIIKFCNRPYKDIDHMNQLLIENHNSVVEPDDTVFFLGDICFGTRSETLPIVNRLHGYKILVPGNHDYVHPMYVNKGSYQYYIDAYSAVFDDVILTKDYFYEGFRLSHFPYFEGMDYAGRDFSEWQPIDDNVPLLCGHVHDEWQFNRTKSGTLMYNVGVDANGLIPIRFNDIKFFLNNM